MINIKLKTVLNNYFHLIEHIKIIYEDVNQLSILNVSNNTQKYKISIYESNNLQWILLVNQSFGQLLDINTLYDRDKFIETKRIFIQKLINKPIYFIGTVNIYELKVIYSFFYISGREMMIHMMSQMQDIFNIGQLPYIQDDENKQLIKPIIKRIQQIALLSSL